MSRSPLDNSFTYFVWATKCWGFTEAASRTFGIILILAMLSLGAFADSTQPRILASGVPQGYQDNPYEYRFGRITDVAFPLQNGKIITNFRFSPVGTYEMFTEQIPLCGDQRKLLDFGPSDVVVVTMTRRMTRRYCHELLRIDVILDARTAGNP
jgi:hypothetical protein